MPVRITHADTQTDTINTLHKKAMMRLILPRSLRGNIYVTLPACMITLDAHLFALSSLHMLQPESAKLSLVVVAAL